MKTRKLVGRLADVNKELLLIFSIIAAAGLVNFFISGQRLILTFYNLPTILAAYYFGRRRAVETALASILFVVWMDLMDPKILGAGAGAGVTQLLLTTSDLAIWSGFLLISAYAMGTLYETAEKNMRELREAYYGVLQILTHFVGNDKYTQHHSYRVSVYAVQIAEEMNLPEERLEDVRAASLLHDIGKLDTSREILYKAARLTDEEIVEMRTHVQKGLNMLSPVGGSLRRILPIILAHHDKFDGSGYRPIKGQDIPVEARIISVADVYDSLISDRPYRKGVSPFEARDMIVKGAGSDFDPKVVKAFESAFSQQKMEVPEVLV